MKIQVVSDLHLEFHNPIPPLVEGVDVVVCAGDLAPVQTGAVFYLAKEWARAKHILYVPGNHEYYGTDIDPAREMLAKHCRHNRITLLDPGTNTIDGVHFIGATLWTDFKIDFTKTLDQTLSTVGAGIADFAGAIQHQEKRFTTLEAKRRHESERAFIEEALERTKVTDQPTVVITHHAPSPASIAPHFEGHPLNAGFASNLEEVIDRHQPQVWIHGHMHDAVDLRIGKTRVLCNPQGYNPEKESSRGYDPGLCIEIDA